MRFFRDLFAPPANVKDGATRDAWFVRMGTQLLYRTRLVAAGHTFRLLEVEIYRRAADHPDPFSHAEQIQLKRGRWYFHMTNGRYRGGSFKGADITFGDGQSYGGILIRTVEAESGEVINGPSLLVDRLMSLTGKRTVAEFDKAIGPHIWDAGSPVHFTVLPKQETRDVYRSARVGLSLRRIPATVDNIRFLLRPDRFVADPAKVRKGRLHLALALMMQNRDLADIGSITGATRSHLVRYREEFDRGRTIASLAGFAGKVLDWRSLCQLHGYWAAHQEATGLKKPHEPVA